MRCIEACAEHDDCLAGQICRSVQLGIGLQPIEICGDTGVGETGALYDLTLGDSVIVNRRISDTYAVNVPNDALSVTLILQQISAPPLERMTFFEVVDASGTAAFDVVSLFSNEPQPIRWNPGVSFGATAMLLPNTDAYPLQRGRLDVSFSTFALPDRSADLRLTARIRRATLGDALDVHLFLVGVGLSPVQAQADLRLQRAIDIAAEIFLTVGIELDHFRYFEIDGATAFELRHIDSVTGPDSELASLFSLSAGQTENAINLFLVESISSSGTSGGTILGVAGGAPGPPRVHGEVTSGVAVAFSESVVGTDPQLLGSVIAHEFGHFLGLFHTRESSLTGAYGGEDTIADTDPTDLSNLMYWSVGSSGNTTLTPGQGFVLKRSSLVH